MNLLNESRELLHLARAHGIARRYFVVNGFDGALTMLGLIIGFLLSPPTSLSLMLNACLGAAIALGMSGISSAYISEVAERKLALSKLEESMIKDLQDSAHGRAAKWVPFIIAVVNGAAPLFVSLCIISPLWLANAGISLFVQPLYLAVILAFLLIFMLGVFLGRIADISWVHSGIQTVVIALTTTALIYIFTG
ncbi:MAG TPA: hypothetical protein DCZ12_12730 [Gammaproteobacteria bacterium]|nr:hypothetical protein [Gammaproteobacteria bacterium]